MTERALMWYERTGFYAIIDPEHCAGRTPQDVTRAVLTGGCAVLQLRAKGIADDSLVQLAHSIQKLCADAKTPFVINDRADIARLVGADGLHLGQDDVPVRDARAVVGNMPIGVSTHSLDQATRAEQDGADLIGFGPVFCTTTKQDPDPVVGLKLLSQVCARANVPVVAIGGVREENARQTRAAGARFVAAIRAITRQDDVARATRTLHAAATAVMGVPPSRWRDSPPT